MNRAVLFSICAAIVIGMSGCNTVRGMGKDIQRAGEGIQNSTSKRSKSSSTKESTPVAAKEPAPVN